MAKTINGVLNPIPFHLIWGNDELRVGEKERFISSWISKYIKFWKLGMLKDDLYFRVMDPYVKYWENILELFSRPIPQYCFVLLESFWPFSNWKTNYEHTSIPTIVDVDLKDLVIPSYCGLKNMCPSLSTIAYMSFLFVGNFVFVQPLDLTVYPMWMGRVESDVARDKKNENYKVFVQWWVLVRKEAKNDEELYHNCWLRKWKNNHVDLKQWVEISCVAFSFSARNNIIVHSMININITHASKVKTNLDAIDNNSYAL
jgi:hypothetical protein